MVQYEAVIVPSYLVPYIKSIIQQYSYQPYGYIPNSETISSNTSTVHDLLTSAVSVGNPSVPVQQIAAPPVSQIAPPPPISQIATPPVSQIAPPPPVSQIAKQEVASVAKQEVPHNIEVIKKSGRYSDHTVCIDWMTSKCSDSSCVYDHYYPTIFKTQLCRYWDSGKCKFKTEECRYAHGKTDSYANLKIDQQRYYMESSYQRRSRSRSRERYTSEKPLYYIDNGPKYKSGELQERNVNYFRK
jgi:hypothetical protein